MLVPCRPFDDDRGRTGRSALVTRARALVRASAIGTAWRWHRVTDLPPEVTMMLGARRPVDGRGAGLRDAGRWDGVTAGSRADGERRRPGGLLLAGSPLAVARGW